MVRFYSETTPSFASRAYTKSQTEPCVYEANRSLSRDKNLMISCNEFYQAVYGVYGATGSNIKFPICADSFRIGGVAHGGGRPGDSF